MGRILGRYVFTEVLVPFVFGLAVFTSVLLIARVLKLVEMVVNRGVPFLEIFKLFSLILPAFLELTIPMALLLAILLAFGRLSSDNELVAMKTSGVSLYQIMLPVCVFAGIIFLFNFAISLEVRPWANGALREQLFEIAKTRATAGFKEKIFNDEFPGLVLYVEEIESGGNALKGVLISDTRTEGEQITVLAKLGLVVPNPESRDLTVRLLDGTIHEQTPDSDRVQTTDFNVYDFRLNLAELAPIGPRQRSAKELSLGELRARIEHLEARGKPAWVEHVELHRKFSIPFACIVFTLVGVPLALQPSRAIRSRGFSVSLALIFMYYILLTVGQTLAESGTLPAIIALWMPNVAFLALGGYLFSMAAEERPIPAIEWTRTRWFELKGRIADRLSAGEAS